MTTMGAQSFKEIVLPVSLVLALSVQCVYLGRRSQHWDDAADAITILRADNQALRQRMEADEREWDRKQYIQDQTTSALAKDLEGLKVFTYGRIDQLPWHTPRYLR